MPQCPHCQTPYENGQRYCGNCGSFLLHPEQGDTFCPQCGIRVSPRQEFCHECDAPLKGAKAAQEALGPSPEPEEAPAAPPSPAPAPAGMPSWLIGLLAASGIIIIILLALLFTRGTSPPPAPASKAEAPAPAAPAAKPAPPALSLTEQLQNVLGSLREAQLQKNIVQFMSVYSLTYPNLDDKRTNTLKSWEHYDYTNLVFTLDKVQPLDPNNAIAWVTWYIDARNRSTQELSSNTQTYQVRFVKELGHWRIRSLEEVEE